MMESSSIRTTVVLVGQNLYNPRNLQIVIAKPGLKTKIFIVPLEVFP